MKTVYFTVVTKHPEAVDAYLYDHSAVVRQVVDYKGSTHMLVRTDADNIDRARHLGRYQAERLSSGMHWSSQVYDLESDAVRQHQERTDVVLDETHVFYEGTSVNGSGSALWLDVIRKVNSLSETKIFGEPVIVPSTTTSPYIEVYFGESRVAVATVTMRDEIVDGQEGQRVRVQSHHVTVDALLTQALTDLALPLGRA